MKTKILSLCGLAVLAFAVAPAYAQQQTGSDYIRLSVEQAKARNYREAERILGECIKVEPRNLECLYRRAIVRQMEIGYGVALEDFNTALSIAPNNVKLLTARGGLLHSMKRPDEALADLNKAIQLAPAHADAFYRRGNIFREKGEDAKAIADYSMAVIADPKNELAYVFRAGLYVKNGEKDLAISDYTRAIALNPTKGSNYYYRGKIYFGQNKTDLAEADFAQAVALDPSMATMVKSTKTLAETDKLLAKWKEDSKPKTPAAAAQEAGFIHLTKKEWDPAIVQLSKAVELEPANHWNFVYRGRAYAGKGDLAKSLADLEKGMSMVTPDQARAFLPERAEIYFKQGKTDLAFSEINKIIASSTTPNAHDLLLRGKIYAKLGNKTSARKDLEKAIELNKYLQEAKDELAKL